MPRRGTLQWLVYQMSFDDLLVFRNWHAVEYLYLEKGLPHYRVFRGDELIGVARIRHPAQTAVVQSKLVQFLAARGCNPRTAILLEGTALTPLNAKVRDLPALPLVSAPRQMSNVAGWC